MEQLVGVLLAVVLAVCGAMVWKFAVRGKYQ